MGIRLIQAGLGGWGRNWHDTALPAVPEAEVVAIVDLSADVLGDAARTLGLPVSAGFPDLGSALKGVDADAVLVTAGLPAHLPLATQALEAGKHVLVEKPFGPTVVEAARVVELAESRGLVLAVSQNYRYYAAARTAAELLASGELGPVGTVRVDFRKWANDREPGHRHLTLPNVLLYDMAIHHFDLMRMVLRQEPVRVYAKAVDPPWSKFTSHAGAVLTIEFSEGATVSYRGSWVSSGPPTPWSGNWHLECELGEIAWHGPERLRAADDGEPHSVEEVFIRKHGEDFQQVDPGAVPYRDRAGTMAAFVEAIQTGTPPETSGRDNLHTLALAETARRSILSGEAEHLPEL